MKAILRAFDTNFKMAGFLLQDKRTFLLIPADIVVFTGVLRFGWDAERILLFLGLDICLCILSFVIYMIVLRGFMQIPDALTASLMVIIPGFFIVKALLVPPYYDFAIFVIFSVMAHVFDVRKYLTYDKRTAQPGFAIYVAWLFLMAPALYVLILVFQLMTVPMNMALVLSFIFIRHFTEYKRYKKFIEIEDEIKSLAGKV